MREKLALLRSLLALRAWLKDPTLQGSAAAIGLGGLTVTQSWQTACEQAGTLIPAQYVGLASVLVGGSIIVARALTSQSLATKAAPPEPPAPPG